MNGREIIVKGFRVKEGLFYTKEHEWLRVEDLRGVIGITDYAQKSLHEIVFVELPTVGTRVEKGAPLGAVESIKAVSDVYSPVSGTVEEINEELREKPELLNEDPYSHWIVKVKIERPEELKELMDARSYAEFLSSIE